MTATTASSAKPYLQIQGLVKKFGDNYAVDNIDLDIYQHEIFALFGQLQAVANPHCCACWQAWKAPIRAKSFLTVKTLPSLPRTNAQST